jgi:hypothetical protein
MAKMDKKQICFVACLALPSISFAADNCSGYYIETSQTLESTEIAKGTSLLVFRSTNIGTTDDPKNPMNMTAGECSGAGITTPDGNFTGRGLCVRKDKDGDVFSWKWDIAAGAQKGTWELVGGTGKYANAKNSGWFEGTLSQGKMSGGRWGGTCQ